MKFDQAIIAYNPANRHETFPRLRVERDPKVNKRSGAWLNDFVHVKHGRDVTNALSLVGLAVELVRSHGIHPYFVMRELMRIDEVRKHASVFTSVLIGKWPRS